MKKWMLWMLTLLLMFPMVNVEARSSSSFSEGSDDRIHTKNQWEVFSDTIYGEVLCSDGGVYIVEDQHTYFIETSASVSHYLVIEDVDQDGIKDMVVFMKSQDHFDNLAILSVGKKEQIASRAITFEQYNKTLGYVQKNHQILSLTKAQENQFFIIVDHEILCLNTALDIVYRIEDQDNIWRIVNLGDINQDEKEDYAYTCQRGAIVAFDGTNGKILYDQLLTSTIEANHPYQGSTYSTTLNTWDILVNDDHLYVTGEDGILYIVDKIKGERLDRIDLDLYQEKSLEKTLSENNFGYDENYSSLLFPTGLWNPYFDDIRLVALDDHRLLIYAFFGSDQYRLQEQSDLLQVPKKYHTPVLLVYDMEKNDISQRITIENYDLKSSDILVHQDEEHTVVQVLSRLSHKGVLLSIYDIDEGNLLENKEIPLLSDDQENVSLYLGQRGNTYVLSRKDHYVLKVDEHFENVMPLTTFLVPRCLYHDGKQMILAYDQGSKTKKIIAYRQQDLLWEIHLPEALSDASFKQLHLEGNLLYGLIDVQEGEVVSSYLCCYDVETGENQLMTRCVVSQGYDERGKAYPIYAYGENIVLQADLNQDGYRDFLVDRYLISGRNGQLLAQNEAYFDTGNGLAIGDLNQDGLMDYAVASDKEIRLYTSKSYREGNSIVIDYVKTQAVYTYDASLQNKEMAIAIQDLNQDGLQEIVINQFNSHQQPIYTVLNGRDLTRLYDLMEDGIYDWGERFYFSTVDLNQDGWNDILYESPFGEEMILDGKTGKPWFYLSGPYEDHPEGMVLEPSMISIISEENQYMPTLIDDINQDGRQDIAYLAGGVIDERYGLILTILDGHTGEIISENMISQQDDGEGKRTLTPLSSSTWILSTSQKAWLYDMDHQTIIASFQQEIRDGFYLDDQTLLVLDEKRYVSPLNIDHDFSVEGISDHISKKVQFQLLKPEEKGYVKVWDQGELCALIEGDEGSFYLKEGKHILEFEFCNEQGKSLFVTKEVQVKNRSIVPYLLYLGALLMMSLMLGLAFYPTLKNRFNLIKGGEHDGK